MSQIGRLGRVLLLSLHVFPARAGAGAQQENREIEVTRCQGEKLIFWLWSLMAGGADERNVDGLEGVNRETLETVDGRELRGYRIATDRPRPRGYILVVQGNAQLADQLVPLLHSYRSGGYDIFVYDYRGFGASEGKRRLNAMISDYGEIVQELNGRSYEQRVLYGLSFGGVVLLNAVSEKDYDSLVIEATRGDISAFECPTEWSPPRQLPADCSEVLLMASESDPVIDAEDMEPLLDQARLCGASVVVHSAPYHPFMSEPAAAQRKRWATILDFLESAGRSDEQ